MNIKPAAKDAIDDMVDLTPTAYHSYGDHSDEITDNRILLLETMELPRSILPVSL